ncbi:MAG: PilZ domain-containing protein [Desulfobacteraceae bacterium]|nr:PilZ domain-containing protein [Desulfobacteraceae bacterium]
MCTVSKRAFPRNICEARIKFSIFDKPESLNAIMYNNSEGGMYFESGSHIDTGSDICIELLDNWPDSSDPVTCNGYRGEVMWRRKIFKNGGVSCYGVGVRFMVNVCDKCGEKVTYSEIQKTDNLLFLCNYCFDQLEDWSGGKIGECLDNYLMGNIL